MFMFQKTMDTGLDQRLKHVGYRKKIIHNTDINGPYIMVLEAILMSRQTHLEITVFVWKSNVK